MPNDSFLSLKNTYFRRLKLKINDHGEFCYFLLFFYELVQLRKNV